ncbi:PREDICTED: uncharacterized protein LOC109157625 [Ipomoea nil]|uniref:uncharacterized protein LOC109157625 n=1 Tax=Ipomoea nil TaxID=35883 RepID=UPI000900BE84|nr:PREDICTED: uncharacterized protein LOC109157625 [Ipomoea nil]
MADSDVASMCANLTLVDVDDDDVAVQLPIAPEDQAEVEGAYYAVGRLVTNKTIRLPLFHDTMAAVWRPVMGVNMRELEPRKYLFRFYHEKDVTRIIEQGPWTFERSLLIMKMVPPGQDPASVPLTHVEFWVQIHALTSGFRSETVVTTIGSFLGACIKTDERNFDGTIRKFYRVQVPIDVAKPIRKQMNLKRDNSGWVLIDFKYERLPTFCFLCGIIGHGDKFCHKYLTTDDGAEKPYRAWLRAGNRRGVTGNGKPWILLESTSERLKWNAATFDSLSSARPTGGGGGRG